MIRTLENIDIKSQSPPSDHSLSLSSLDSHDNSPILKPTTHKKSDLLPTWFKEINLKYDKFCEDLSRVKADQEKLASDLKRFDERKLFLEKSKPHVKKSLLSLNYHLIFLIIRLTKEESKGYLPQLAALARVNRHFNRILDSDFIWKSIAEEYFGSEFIQKNEENARDYNQKHKDSYWKRTMKVIYERLSLLKRSMRFYKESNCPKKIESKSFQKELGLSLKFMIEVATIFLDSKEKSLFYSIFFEFVRNEKILNLLEMLSNSNNLFLCSFTIDFFIIFANFENEFGTRIKELIAKIKLHKQIEKLYRNHEQELQIRLASLFSEFVVLPEIIFFMKNKGINTILLDPQTIRPLSNLIINRNLEKCNVTLFQHGILEEFPQAARVFISKEGKCSIEMGMRGFNGCFIFRNLSRIWKNSEVWRGMASGRLVGLGMEMGAYIGMAFSSSQGQIAKNFYLYASNNSHDYGIVVKLF